MITDANIADAYERIKNSNSPVVVWVEGVHSSFLKTATMNVFSKKSQNELIHESAIVGTYQNKKAEFYEKGELVKIDTFIEYDLFAEEARETEAGYQPSYKNNDPIMVARRLKQIILNQKKEFTKMDIVNSGQSNLSTVSKHISDLVHSLGLGKAG